MIRNESFAYRAGVESYYFHLYPFALYQAKRDLWRRNILCIFQWSVFCVDILYLRIRKNFIGQVRVHFQWIWPGKCSINKDWNEIKQWIRQVHILNYEYYIIWSANLSICTSCEDTVQHFSSSLACVNEVCPVHYWAGIQFRGRNCLYVW